MKMFLILLNLAITALAEPQVSANYHRDIGIPAARAIRHTELKGLGGSRIIGGSVSSLGQFPYFAGLDIELTSGRRSVCGSSLLTNTKVVTAAHCWRDRSNQGQQLTVVLGSVQLYSGGTRITTNRVEVHDSYDVSTFRNDVAMITIDPVEFSDVISPIAIATGNNSYAGVTAMVVGFGKTGDRDNITKDQVLRNVSMPVITNEECKRTYGRYIVNTTLCTSTTRGTRATCSGDSGGPLSVGNGDDRLLIGIVSFGSRSCQSRNPKALSRVTAFASWINERI